MRYVLRHSRGCKTALMIHIVGAPTGSASSVLTENSQIGGERIIVNKIETPSIIESVSGKLKIIKLTSRPSTTILENLMLFGFKLG